MGIAWWKPTTRLQNAWNLTGNLAGARLLIEASQPVHLAIRQVSIGDFVQAQAETLSALLVNNKSVQ
jgi:hypothetical protein